MTAVATDSRCCPLSRINGSCSSQRSGSSVSGADVDSNSTNPTTTGFGFLLSRVQQDLAVHRGSPRSLGSRASRRSRTRLVAGERTCHMVLRLLRERRESELEGHPAS